MGVFIRCISLSIVILLQCHSSMAQQQVKPSDQPKVEVKTICKQDQPQPVSKVKRSSGETIENPRAHISAVYKVTENVVDKSNGISKADQIKAKELAEKKVWEDKLQDLLMRRCCPDEVRKVRQRIADLSK